MKAPGSPSSPLHTTYLGKLSYPAAVRHFRPVGKPAPPRPLRPDSSTWVMISSGVMARAFFKALYPPRLT